jgi:hypothetical protein
MSRPAVSRENEQNNSETPLRHTFLGALETAKERNPNYVFWDCATSPYLTFKSDKSKFLLRTPTGPLSEPLTPSRKPVKHLLDSQSEKAW